MCGAGIALLWLEWHGCASSVCPGQISATENWVGDCGRVSSHLRPVPSIPDHHQHPLQVPGTQDTSQRIRYSHDIPQEVQGPGEYIATASVQEEDHIAEHEIWRWNSMAEAVTGLYPSTQIVGQC